MLVPLGQRATDDLANIMTHSAERWSLIDTNSHPQFAKEMLEKHQLIIKPVEEILEQSNSFLPYLYFLEQAIQKHQGSGVHLKQSRDKQGVEWFWVDIPANDQIVRIGFQRGRIGVQPPFALMLVMLVGLFLTLMTAVVLTRRLTIPVEQLYHAAHDIGKGHWPEPIKEDGPEELKTLARTFNLMNKQVKELLANRTTLLAGIAHDLRTPLTQIQLALEMLPDNGGDPELMESINNDLGRINHLISESLSIGTELAEEEEQKVDIAEELEIIIHNHQHDDIAINWSREQPCLIKLHALAFRRVINNLLENAIRYGNGKPVDVFYKYEKKSIFIIIEDRGAGIPKQKIEEVFRPFYRLEQSRGSGTGGSGLGLAIVKQLSDSHGWTVDLNTRDGGGTSAQLIIPKMRPL
jgi:two-component system osmolarity sensor histidine kinase EnvZ